MVSPAAISAGIDVANLGFGIYDRFAGDGSSDTAVNDTRFMNDFAWKQSLRNEEFQKELARNGIRMRVADAEAAGLHPLVGAGINPASGGFSTSGFVGAQQNPSPRQFNAPSFGQNISRAAAATMTEEERLLMHANTQKALAEADFAQSQAALARRQVANLGKTPPIPKSHIQIMNEDGSISTINNPDIAGAIMSDPLGMWGTSLSNTGDSIRRVRNAYKWTDPRGWRTIEAERDQRLNYKNLP